MAKVKASAGFSGKIPTGSYQNSNPSFYAEMEMDALLEGDALMSSIDSLQKLLHNICYQNFKIVADAAHIEKLKNDRRGFRFYKTPNGDYPSVTTVLDPEFKAYCTEEELEIAIAEGNINHARAAHYITTGEWVEPKKLDGVAPALLLLKGRIIDGWDFPAMLVKYPIQTLVNGRQLVNHEHRYAGTNDCEGLYLLGGGNGAEAVPTIMDFKRTPDRDKNFAQMAAYARCEGMEHIKQMMIVPANTETQQGFSKPILSASIDKYFEVFLHKRREFQRTYGV